jgi:hypothetical protein
VEEEFDARLVPVLVDVINPSRVEYRRAADDSVDLMSGSYSYSVGIGLDGWMVSGGLDEMRSDHQISRSALTR